MLAVVFFVLLSVGVCCALQSVCRRYKCCATLAGSFRDTSFDAAVSRSNSCFREDLVNDDELQRLWICWHCDFANYEMKLQCALCSHPKKLKDVTQSGSGTNRRYKPSAVRPASPFGASGPSFSFSSPRASPRSMSAVVAAAAALSPTGSLSYGRSPSPTMSSGSVSSTPSTSYFDSSFLLHMPLEPLLESPASTHRSAASSLSSIPESPRLSVLSAASLLSLPLIDSSNNEDSDNDSDSDSNDGDGYVSSSPQHQQQPHGFASSRARRKEWRTRVTPDNAIVWSWNTDLASAASSTDVMTPMSTADLYDRAQLIKLSLGSPASFLSVLLSPPSSTAVTSESIVQATAFVSRVIQSSAAPPSSSLSTTSAHNQQQHGTLELEPAAHARVYASLEAVNTDPTHPSCGIVSHRVESVRALSFPEKHRWFMQETSSLLRTRWGSPGNSSELTLVVPRDDLVAATVQGLMRITPQQLRRPLRVQFANEPGVDAGGLVREWVSLAVAAFLEPAAGLFQCIRTSDDAGLAYTIHANASLAVEAHLVQLRALGRLLGKALLEGHLVDAPLTDVLFKHILSAPVSFADLQAVDRKLAHSLQLLWATPLTDSSRSSSNSPEHDNNDNNNDNDADGASDDDDDPYALDFSIYHPALGTVDLKPNGRNVTVTERNKREYVTLFVQWHLANAVAAEVSALVCGIYDVVPVHLLAPFDYTELRLLLCGSPTIDVDDWETHTVVAGRSSRAASRVATWFWRQLRALAPAEQARILQFATGSLRVPIQGFKALTASDGRLCRFTLQCLPQAECAFFRAFTCFNRLDVPLYKTESDLTQALVLLLQTDVTGFSVQ